MKILIADDAATVRNLIADILREAGFDSIEFAIDGGQALARLTQPGIDLALLDWHMPVLSGMDVLKALRESGCKIPIVLVTAESAPQSVRSAVNAGVDQYVAKPFRPDLLVDKVFRALTIKCQAEPSCDVDLMNGLLATHSAARENAKPRTSRRSFHPVHIAA